MLRSRLGYGRRLARHRYFQPGKTGSDRSTFRMAEKANPYVQFGFQCLARSEVMTLRHVFDTFLSLSHMPLVCNDLGGIRRCAMRNPPQDLSVCWPRFNSLLKTLLPTPFGVSRPRTIQLIWPAQRLCVISFQPVRMPRPATVAINETDDTLPNA